MHFKEIKIFPLIKNLQKVCIHLLLGQKQNKQKKVRELGGGEKKGGVGKKRGKGGGRRGGGRSKTVSLWLFVARIFAE